MINELIIFEYFTSQEKLNREHKEIFCEAVRLVNKYDDEFPKKYFHDFLDYIKISENEYWETIDQARPKNLWKQDGNKWILKNKVV